MESNTPIPFKELIRREHEILDQVRIQSTIIAPPSVTHEPWVRFTARDYFGLALSGGGIRSATFNLGLLQALDEKEVLDSVDYLSTVSGGGYVGGFWSAWLLRGTSRENLPRGAFPRPETNPKPAKNSPLDPREPGQIRHLREYSRFIIPRIGSRNSKRGMRLLRSSVGFCRP